MTHFSHDLSHYTPDFVRIDGVDAWRHQRTGAEITGPEFMKVRQGGVEGITELINRKIREAEQTGEKAEVAPIVAAHNHLITTYVEVTVEVVVSGWSSDLPLASIIDDAKAGAAEAVEKALQQTPHIQGIGEPRLMEIRVEEKPSPYGGDK